MSWTTGVPPEETAGNSDDLAGGVDGPFCQRYVPWRCTSVPCCYTPNVIDDGGRGAPAQLDLSALLKLRKVNHHD